ncbi:hypothetical protein JJL45_03130 [Tamlana sp. s12]|uniref:hypothetical protein n=1 Tax=Tamlana sp. s12 TaxID=1630406 RepID=UPI000B0EE2F5|nr:hypothetical protein [Tamlana sp. s12]QQY83001.1 hypothetical protein JJL45_03130 [Tamlana sp. s12]
MKVYLSYLLFFVLALRPIYNMGCVAYYELNIDYIIETYCVNKENPEFKCNGKCHLATQLAANSNPQDENSYLSFLFETFIPVYFQEAQPITFYKNNANRINYWHYKTSHNAVFRDQPDLPPQV